MSDTLQTIRDYAGSLQGADRQSFINKFNAIKNDDAKISTLASRIQGINAPATTEIPQRTDRLSIKSQKPYTSYSYGDAAADTGKTVVNSLANLGENTINAVKGIGDVAGRVVTAPLHPIKAATDLGNALYQAPGAIIKGVGDKIGEYNSMDKLASKVSTDPFGFGSDVVGAASLASGAPAAGKAIGGTATKVGEFFNFDKKGLDLASRVRTLAAKSHQGAVDTFGAEVDNLAKANPTLSVSIQHVIDDIKNNQNLTDTAKTAFNKTPFLRDMLKNPGEPGYVNPNNVPLKDVQSIINHINTKIPRNIKANSLDILDAQNDIRAAQLDAFPVMAPIRDAYRVHAEDYKLIKGHLRPGATVNAIRSNFSGNVEVKDAAKRIFENSDVLKDAAKYRGQMGTVNFIKRLVTLGVAKEGGWKLLQK